MESNKISRQEYLNAIEIINKYKTFEAQQKGYEINVNSKFSHVTKDTLLLDVASVRILNILKCYEEVTGIKMSKSTKVGDLSKISLRKFRGFRGVGRKTINELKELCFYADIPLFQ